MKVHGHGNPNADIFIVGEAPGQKEAYHGRPFLGGAGQMLDGLLAEQGVDREEVFVSNVSFERPRDNDISLFFANKTEAKKLGLHAIQNFYPRKQILEGMLSLAEEIERVDPKVIIACGNIPLWALTGFHNPTSNSVTPTGIFNYRGSMLYTTEMFGSRRVVPTIHPAAIMRAYESRWFTAVDFKRALKDVNSKRWNHPEYNFIIRPTYEQVMGTLRELHSRAESSYLRIAVDIETRLRHISCIGLAWSNSEALCIPFMEKDQPEGYWSVDEEADIIHSLLGLLNRASVSVVGQNFDYDSQYIAREWGAKVVASSDTMIRQHVLFPGTPKDLNFLSSLYCGFHEYWKDEGKEWNPKLHDEERHWTYNCKDCVTTLEVEAGQQPVLEQLDRLEVESEQMRQVWPVLKLELRGWRVDTGRRAHIIRETEHYLKELEEWFEFVIPESYWPRKKNTQPWYRSPTQQVALFYYHFKLPTQLEKRGKGGKKTPSVNDDSLKAIRDVEPILTPVIDNLLEYRSFNTLLNNFLRAPLENGRMYTSINLCGTETFRYSSSRGVFGFGTNIQNITKGDK